VLRLRDTPGAVASSLQVFFDYVFFFLRPFLSLFLIALVVRRSVLVCGFAGHILSDPVRLSLLFSPSAGTLAVRFDSLLETSRVGHP